MVSGKVVVTVYPKVERKDTLLVVESMDTSVFNMAVAIEDATIVTNAEIDMFANIATTVTDGDTWLVLVSL